MNGKYRGCLNFPVPAPISPAVPATYHVLKRDSRAAETNELTACMDNCIDWRAEDHPVVPVTMVTFT